MVEETKCAQESAALVKNEKPPMLFRVKTAIKRNYTGWLFIMPTVLGILFFTLYPMVASLVYSFFDYNVVDPPHNFGFQNYIRPFTEGWPEFSKSLQVTFVYSIVSIPLNMVLSFALALMLNQKAKGMRFFRLLYYLPVIIPSVVSGLLWRDIMQPNGGIMNAILEAVGLPASKFFMDKNTAMPTLIFTGLFGLGGGMILWIASLKNISPALYEAADIEGANYFVKLFRITIPMCSPVIFYNLITGVIGALQTFGGVFVITGGGGGVDNSMLFYVMNIYNQAFSSRLAMGYASALSWILFVIIGILTFIMFKTSKWVYYGGEQ